MEGQSGAQDGMEGQGDAKDGMDRQSGGLGVEWCIGRKEGTEWCTGTFAAVSRPCDSQRCVALYSLTDIID